MRLVDPVDRVGDAGFALALVLDIAAAVIIFFAVVVDLGLVVLLGDLGLAVGVTILQVEKVDGIGDEAGQQGPWERGEDRQGDV